MKTIVKDITTLLLFVLLLASGCSQKDSTVGSDFAGGLSDLHQVIIEPAASAFYQDQATTGSSPYLYIGYVQDYEARTLLKFNPATVLPDSFAVDSVAVKLFLDPDYEGFSGDPLEIDVSFVNPSQEWAEVGVTWDTLDSLDLDDPILTFPVSQYQDSASFRLPEPFETTADSVFADSLIRAWDDAGAGGKTLHYNNGLYLQAKASSGSMLRFCSAEYEDILLRPSLEFYVTVFDTSDTTGIYPLSDTLFIQADADAFIAKDYVGITDSTMLYLGNAIAHRSMLLFDIEGLFPTYGIGIHRAEIILHADTTHPCNNERINGSFHLRMEDTTWISDPAMAPIAFGDVPVLSVYDEESATLKIKLNDLVYDWIEYPGTNQGFMIKSFDEYLNLSRTVFYGIEAPDSLRPRLSIIYLEGEI